MKKTMTSTLALASTKDMDRALEAAWSQVGESFEQFCLTAGLASLTQMLGEDAEALAGTAHAFCRISAPTGGRVATESLPCA